VGDDDEVMLGDDALVITEMPVTIVTLIIVTGYLNFCTSHRPPDHDDYDDDDDRSSEERSGGLPKKDRKGSRSATTATNRGQKYPQQTVLPSGEMNRMPYNQQQQVAATFNS